MSNKNKNETNRILSNYQQFLVSIETNINKDSRKRSEIQQKIEEIEAIQETIQYHKDKNLANSDTLYDIGYNNFVEAEIINDTIIINIGLDVYIEMPREKAYEFLETKKNILNKKLIYFNELIAKNKSHYKVTDRILKELKMQIEIDQLIEKPMN